MLPISTTVWDAQNWRAPLVPRIFVSAFATPPFGTCKVVNHALMEPIFDAISLKFHNSMFLFFWPPKSGIPTPQYLYVVDYVRAYHLPQRPWTNPPYYEPQRLPITLDYWKYQGTSLPEAQSFDVSNISWQQTLPASHQALYCNTKWIRLCSQNH